MSLRVNFKVCAPRDSDVVGQFALSHMTNRPMTVPHILRTPLKFVQCKTLIRRCRLVRAERCDSISPYRVLRDKRHPRKVTTSTSTLYSSVATTQHSPLS